jgi:hypothetical protein
MITMEKCSKVWKEFVESLDLCMRSIYPDLKCFSILELILLAIFAAASIVFSFISFDHLYDPVMYPSIYNVVNDRLMGKEVPKIFLLQLI